MNEHLLLTRFQKACTDLHDGKVKTRKQAIEDISNLLDNPNLIMCLNRRGNEWNNTFVAVKTLFYLEMGKLEEEIAKKGQIGPRPSAFSCECRDLLHTVVKNANAKHGIISFPDYYSYVTKCRGNAVFKRYCLETSLTVFDYYFLMRDSYWDKITLDQITEMKDFFKSLHLENPAWKALRCYKTLLQMGARYKLPIGVIKGEIEFVKFVVRQLNGATRWLLECAAQLFLVFCECCGASYRRLCAAEGEHLLCYLFCFYNPNECVHDFRASLLEAMLAQLEYHENGEFTTKWREALMHIGGFIKSCVDANDRLVMTDGVDGVQFGERFVAVARLCYKQSLEAKRLAVVDESRPKRPRQESTFLEIFDYLENNLHGAWILLFSLIFEKYPQLLPQNRFEALLRAFSNYVKDSSSITIQGYVYKWLCNLIHIEELLAAQDGDYSMKNNESEWLLVYDSATRSIGLNQNTKESHVLLQLIIAKKPDMLSTEDAAKLGNLYRSQAMHPSEASLKTFHAYAQHLGARANVDHVAMIDAVLSGDAAASVACAIAADVLVNLAFKHYTQARETTERGAHVFDRRSHDHLLAILRRIVARTLERDCDEQLELVHLFAHLLRCYAQYELDVDELLHEVRPFVEGAWRKLKAFFASFLEIGVERRAKTLAILKRILETDAASGAIARTIEFWFVEEMARAQCELDTDYLALTHPDVRLKLLIVEIFAIFALRCDTEAQRSVQVMLYEFQDFDPCSDVDYQQAVIILDALDNDDCALCAASVAHLINLIKKVCQRRVNEYAVCARMLRALKHCFRHLLAMPDLTDDVKGEYLRVYRNLHRMRKNYGHGVELALVECLGALLAPRRSLTWASHDGDVLVETLLPGFLRSDHQEVKREAVRTLALVFEHPSTNSETDRLKSDILRKVLDAFALDQHVGDECFQDNVLGFLAKVVVSARGTKFTKRALGEIFVATKKFDVPIEKVHDVLKDLEGHVEIKSHVNIVLQFWCKSYQIAEFPYRLLGVDSLRRFYTEYLSFIVLIALRSNDEETLEAICSQIGRTESDVVEECYPKFIANNLIERCLHDGRTKGGNDTTMGNIGRLTQVKLQELVPSDKSKTLLKLTIDEVLVEVIKHIHDPVHFEQFFQYNVCIPNLETPTVTFAEFRDILTSLGDDLKDKDATDVVKFICEIRPGKIEQVLLKLKLNYWEKRNNEDKMIAFYHYALFVDCVLRHEINESLVIFVLRDVVYNNINLIKHSGDAADGEDVIRTLALKFMSSFVKLVLAKYPKRFAEFLIVVCSTMLPFAALGNADARRVLESILHADDEHVADQLKYLDPLPDDNEHVKDLRARHLQFRTKDASLESEINLFLSGAQCKESRVEGLKHLRSRLKANLPALKNVYLKLHEMRGILAKRSALHELIAALVVLVRSKDETESLEAAKCLGVLGASDLTTMVLKSEDVVQTKDDSSYLFTSKVVALLNELLVDGDAEAARCASVAMHAVLATADGRHVVRNEAAFAKMRGVFVPFVASGGRAGGSLLAVTRDLAERTLTDEALWCGERMTADQWITTLTARLLEGCQHDVMKCLVPIVAKKASFAETIFPFLVNLLLDASADVRRLVGSCVRTFFDRHWAGADDAATANVAAVKCVLNALHFVRLQRLCDKRGKYRELDLDLNYLHVAKAAGFCSAHFSALMYAEKWYHASVHNSAKISPHTLSPISFLDEIGEETSQLRSVLSQAYEGIGDTNALYGGHLDVLEARTELGPTHGDQSQYFRLLRSDLLLSSSGEASEQMTRIFRDCAFYNLAISTAKIHAARTDAFYECMWRMSRWDVREHDAPATAGFECNVYNLLNAINDGDRAAFDAWAKKTRRQVADSLKSVSLESCKTLYGSLSELERLRELEDVFAAVEGGVDLRTLAAGFLQRDEIQSDFKYWEPRMAQRIAAIAVLGRRGCAGADEVHVEMNLRYADLSREHGNLQISKRALSKFLHLDDPEVKAKVELLDARIDWKLGRTSSISKLKTLLKSYAPQTRLRSSVLKLCGEWLVANKSEFPQKILRDYFLPCVAILNNQNGSHIQHGEFDVIHDVYNTLAKFADEEYQHISRSIKSPEFVRKVASMNKMIETANKLKTLPNISRDVKKAIVTYERLTKIDEIDVKAKHAERDTFLKVAIKYYLFNMKYSTEVQAEIFRIFSLWLENKSNEDVHNEIEENLLQVESYKILTMLPQLVPHISVEDDRFSKCVNLLIENCAKQHPHHAIPLILCVANTNKDSHYCKENAETASNESRIAGASQLVDKLRKMPELTATVEQNERLATALIELAYYKTKPNEGSTTKIPRMLLVHGIRDYTAALVPTYNLAHRPSLNYRHVVGVHSFRQEFGNVGGVNAPKRLECVGTDGVARYLLVKGQDDLRQDAVMQQVFGIINELLRTNEATLNFAVRTYKVVPLSKRSGVLEWVSDSMPVGEYLVDAHAHYHPRDKTPERARLEIREAVARGAHARLKTFLGVCEKMRPVFHKFFETNFLQPTVWYEKRKAYTQSVAVSSMCGFVLGIGDRHVKNILVDKTTAEVVHIDFGIAFEMGKVLPTPETVPFRLTRDFVDGMGVCGVEGTFRKTCEQTMAVLRRNVTTIQTIVEVLLYDPLYDWSITPTQAYSKQLDDDSKNDSQFFTSDDDAETNVSAERALARLRHRLLGTDSGSNTSVETQVDRLIQQAREPSNLSKLFYGWQAFL